MVLLQALSPDNFTLVKADEHDQPDRQGQHTDGAEKQHH